VLRAETLVKVQAVIGSVVKEDDVDAVELAVLAVDDWEFDAVRESDEDVVEIEPLWLEEEVTDAEFELLAREPGDIVDDDEAATDVVFELPATAPVSGNVAVALL